MLSLHLQKALEMTRKVQAQALARASHSTDTGTQKRRRNIDELEYIDVTLFSKTLNFAA